MKTFKVEGWFRYRNADEKDFEQEIIKCNDVQLAIQLFTDKYNKIHFFKIYTTEII